MLSKKVWVTVLVLAAVVLGTFAIYRGISILSTASAKSNLRELQALDVLRKLESEDTFLLYVGRDTCPACVNFLPRLSQFLREMNLECFYLDSEKTQENVDLKSFRDAHGIRSVPSFILFQEGLLVFRFTTSDEFGNRLREEFEILDPNVREKLVRQQ